MGIEKFGFGEKCGVGGDQRDILRIGHVDQGVLGCVFNRIISSAKFDVKSIRKKDLKIFGIFSRSAILSLGKQSCQCSFAARGQGNQTLGQPGHLFECNVGIMVFRPIKMRHRHQATQIMISKLILRIER